MKKLMIVFCIGFLFSCKKDKEIEEPTPAESFDRAGLLVNVGTNVIIPNYESLLTSLDSLVASSSAFTSNVSQSSLNDIRTKWFAAYRDWMHCSTFEFGPAANVALRSTINTFPSDTAQINSNISSGSYDLTSAINIDAIGFPAVDFLLHRSSDAQVMADFNASAGMKTYLNDVISEMRNKVQQVYNSWISSGGNYISVFQNASGTDVGSSLGYLVNQINYDYEILKNARIGIPLGKKTLNVPLPGHCEAYFSTRSIELAAEFTASIENIFRGRSRTGADGSGLEEYLNHVGATSNGVALATAINNKLSEVQNALIAIPGILSDAVVNNTAPVETAYTRILEGLVLLKGEMPSALGILITYQDSDGD